MGVDEAFDALVSRAASAMVVVTTAVDGVFGGCLVGFHSQCSIEPRRYALWMSNANRTYDLVVRADHVAVHLLSAEQRDVAVLFGGATGDEVDKFAEVSWQPGPSGVPLLEDCPARFVLRRTTMVDLGGDHVCFVGEPVVADRGPRFRPLRLPAVDDVEPGHDADDRR